MMSSTSHDFLSSPMTLVQLLRERAAFQPEQWAYTFLQDGEEKDIRLSYGQLDLQARTIALQLSSVASTGERALLLYPPGLEYIAAFFGCLYAGLIPVPAYPPRHNRSFLRVQTLVEDAQATVALTTTPLLARITTQFRQYQPLQALRWVSTDQTAMWEDTGQLDHWQEPQLDGSSLAFLQYTSGSTGEPKGVMVTHANLMDNLAQIQQKFGHTAESLGVSWLPPYHDMGLIGSILQPLFVGFPCVLLSPTAFLERPIRWLQAISRYRATTSGGPNFAYELCLHKISDTQHEGLDLSSWNVAFTGAESVRDETLTAFSSSFAACGFRARAWYPCYGLAEATLMVSGGEHASSPVVRRFDATALEQHQVRLSSSDQSPAATLVSCGQPLSNQDIKIVQAETGYECQPDQVGEIWLASPGVARGYWNHPFETKDIFHAFVAETGQGPFLRTGDLGFVQDGQLFVTGRLKDMLIIRGRNHYPQDIEATVGVSHAALRTGNGAVFSIEREQQERLVVVQEVSREVRHGDQDTFDALIGTICAAISEQHELQAHSIVLIRPGSLLKTSSGKIQRQACKAAFLAGELAVVARSDIDNDLTIARGAGMTDDLQLSRSELLALSAEERDQRLSTMLKRLIAEELHVPLEQITAEVPINTFGLDSLSSTHLSARLEEALGSSVPFTDFLQGVSITQLSARVSQDLVTSVLPAELLNGPISRPHETSRPLSFSQERFWFLDQLVPGNPAYTIAGALQLSGSLHLSAFEQSWHDLIQRHAVLRTTFAVVDGRLVQAMKPAIPLPLALIDLETGTHESEDVQKDTLQQLLRTELERPFDLEAGPLLRITLWRLSVTEQVLLLTVHHSIADGWSLGVLQRELGILYRGHRDGHPAPLSLLPELPLHYSDYAVWQRDGVQRDGYTRELAYWREQLMDAPALLSLPTDRPRPAQQSFHGAIHHFHLPASLAEALQALSQREGVTLFMALFTTFQILLARYSGQEDILVGTPVANRLRVELEMMVGCFINLLAVRTDLTGNPTFSALLQRVHATLLEAYAHQGVPFEHVVEAVQPERDLSHTPLFQVLLVLQHTPGTDQDLFDISQHRMVIDNSSTQFDLVLNLEETVDGLSGGLQYNTDLFDATTIARLVTHWCALLPQIVADPQQHIWSYVLLAEQERQQILLDWNAARRDAVPPVRQESIQELFEVQAERCPSALAIVFADQQLSYRELNTRANQLAHYLLQLGVQPDVLVALCMERSCDLIVGILGILKAGGAYVPLDPTYPRERLTFVLEDTQAPILLTQERLAAQLFVDVQQFGCEHVLCLDKSVEILNEQPTENLVQKSAQDHLAYVIYTSGSTGRPKGVLVSHANLVHSTLARSMYYAEPVKGYLLFSSCAFDSSVAGIFWTLSQGGMLCLPEDHIQQDPQAMVRLIERHRLSHLLCVPSFYHVLLHSSFSGQLASLKAAIVAGEACPSTLVATHHERFPATALYNEYGPTEATVWSTVEACQSVSADDAVSIGRPITNVTIYLLDPWQQPVPIGVPGEIYIGGSGVARGYLRRPALTAERFVPDAFCETAGARLYRTGDLARYRVDGAIEFLGRLDQQVKIRGFRIELGEIEALLRKHPALQDAVVLAREDHRGDKRLVAYVVCDPEQRETSSSEIRRYLLTQLPEYMVPSAFLLLNTFPRTQTGKVDRQALPEPQQGRSSLLENAGDGYVTPVSELEQQIMRIWQAELHIECVGLHDNFFDLGGHSLLLVQVQQQLRLQLGRELNVVDLFTYPTVSALAQYLEPSPSRPESTDLKRHKKKRQPVSLEDDIAIIGMSGRFPGASTLDEFWENLQAGVESIATFSDEELRAAGIPEQLLSHPRYVKSSGVLDDIDYFDARFFEYSPREAELMDPQHRLFLEAAWHALENAGYDPLSYPHAIGVYAGMSISSYLANNLLTRQGASDLLDVYQMLIANDKDFLPTRVSYKLNLRGPSVAVQTACSTSLVAVHLACESLRRGQCEMVLAGGVSIGVPARQGYLYQEGGILSPDGHCRPFDAQAQGTVRGSGLGIVVLKRLSDALADGDHIAAVIKSSAINNDGALKVGYTAPSVKGQAQVIADVLAQAGVAPETVSYIETHGTATPMGDPIEIAALTQVFQSDIQVREQAELDSEGQSKAAAAPGWCLIGSVKSNIGHLDAASGIAGLLKTVLALQHRQLPPSLNFRQENPQLDLANSPFHVNDALTPWETSGFPRRAGVSSFGIGGTNAHLLLEEAPPTSPVDLNFTTEDHQRCPWQLLVLSAKTPGALERQTQALAVHLRQHPELILSDVASTLQVGRHAFTHRRALVGQEISEVADVLESSDPTQLVTSIAAASPRPVVFLFPGQGSQYVGMGQDLYEQEPTFRCLIDFCAEQLQSSLGRDLRQILYPTRYPGLSSTEASDLLGQTWITQPALFVVEYALAQLWLTWGIRPSALIGHSLGEYVAACLAGVFSLEDALRLVATRGRLLQASELGSMVAVPLSEAEVETTLREMDDHALSLAAVNGPQQCVVSGPVEAVQRLVEQLASRNIEVHYLPTSHGFHSALMEPMSDTFAQEVAQVDRQAPRQPYLSNVTGTWITASQVIDPHYWVQQLRQPVRFAASIDVLLGATSAEGQELSPARPLFLEVGPGQSLGVLARQHALFSGSEALTSLSHPLSGQDEVVQMLRTLGKLWGSGSVVDWHGVSQQQQPRRVPLPVYPFERQRYWVDPLPQAAPIVPSPAAKRPEIADWFYVPGWKQMISPQRISADILRNNPAIWLVFCDTYGVGSQLVAALEQAGQIVIRVQSGTAFSSSGARAYTINPRRPEDYQTLLAALAALPHALPQQIVHFWSLTMDSPAPVTSERLEQAQTSGFVSLISLAQALSSHTTSAPMHLWVITNNVQNVTGEELLSPEKATILGPCKVIPQEYSQITCSSIDIVLPSLSHVRAMQDVGALLLAELTTQNTQFPDPVIAYRGKQRWVQAFEPISAAQQAGFVNGLRAGGVYLITGGLGQIGMTLIDHLTQQMPLKLVLVGRSTFPARTDWMHWVATHGELNSVSQKINKLLVIEQRGTELLLCRADVAQLEEMQTVICQAEERFGMLHGVIHAAGIIGEQSLRSIAQTGDIERAVLFRAKLDGVLVLEQVLKEKTLDFCLLFSSLAAILGGLGFAAYAAANVFMDTFARQQRRSNGTPWSSINWDAWDFHDRSGSQSLPRREQAITAEEGGTAFVQALALCASGLQLIVSTGDLQARFDTWMKPNRSSMDGASGEPRTSAEQTSFHPRPELAMAYAPPVTELEQQIAQVWCDVLHIETVGLQDNFFDLGGHSLLLAQLHQKLGEQLSQNIALVNLFRYPTVSALAAHLQSEPANTSPVLQPDGLTLDSQSKQVAQQAEVMPVVAAPQPSVTPEHRENDIAIIGMAGRFPGAGTLEEFWANLSAGSESITFFSDAELAAQGVPENLRRNPNYVKAAGILSDVDCFDAAFFGFSPREAELMDPQHRLFLEAAWQALEDAGYDPVTYQGLIGVYAGQSPNTYFLNLLTADPSLLETIGRLQVALGNSVDTLATQVSYKLNLRGPSINIQTACSTSLVAIHQACRSLIDGECDMALAGGVSVHVPHQEGYLYEEGGITSPDGHCRSFDAGAQGTIFTSGLGVIVLKCLRDALTAGDHIVAVIKGSAINNDGALKVGYAAPSVQGQAQVIEKALIKADIAPETISYIEAHGTATPLGDPVEVTALMQAFQARLTKEDNARGSGWCALGSVKSNIGHLDAAAGVAGVLKTVLALQHQQLPPSLHYQQPNPQLDFAHSPFRVNQTLVPWTDTAGPRRAGVSSFGIGGTNAHVILEEAPLASQARESGVRPWQLLVLSAKTPGALERQTQALAAHLRQHPDLVLADVASTLQIGRHAFTHRRTLVGRETAEVADVLESSDPTHLVTSIADDSPRPVVFLFPGQGSQYVGMGQDLYEQEPTFRRLVDFCAEQLQPALGRDLRQILYPTLYPGLSSAEASDLLRQTWITQPALFVVEYSLAQLWLTWGIHPSALIGHSLGEYVAACLVGVFSLEDALHLVATRGRLLQASEPGAMVAVPLSEAQVEVLLQETNHQALSLAAINGPQQCVIAGPVEAVQSLIEQLASRSVEARRLQSSHAFHSALMEPMSDAFAQAVAQVDRQAPRQPYLSNVTGTWITTSQALDPHYWVQQLRQPVRFAASIDTLLGAVEAEGQERQQRRPLFLEVGPGQSLGGLVRQHASFTGSEALLSLSYPHSGQDEDRQMLKTLGKLWGSGSVVDWKGVSQQSQPRRISLPTYPFERQHYWLSPSSEHKGHSPAVLPAALVEEEYGRQEEQRILHDRPTLLPAYIPPTDEAERGMAKIWQDVLGIKQVGRYDTFFEMGGHSVLATQLMTQIRHAFHVDIPLRHLFATPTLAGLTAVVVQQQQDLEEASIASLDVVLDNWPQLRSAPELEDLSFPLTDVQQAYWLGRSGALELGNVSTHGYVEFEGIGIDLERFTQAIRLLIARHGMLRAIVLPDGWQQILPAVPVYQIKTLDLRDLEPDETTAQLMDLRHQLSHQMLPADRWPLFEIRATLLDAERTRLHLSLDMLIMDAWSIQLLGRELIQFYRDPLAMLPPIELSFRDYVLAERALHDSEQYQQAQSYWRSRLDDIYPAPVLPLAQSPSALTNPRFVRHSMRLGKDEWQRLKERAAQATLTPSGVLLAAFAQVLSIWSTSPQFTLNLTLFNRLPLHPQVNNLVGDFTSLTLLTVDYALPDTFEERARRLQEQLWTDLDHRLMTGVQMLRELARAQQRPAIAMPVVFTSTLIQDQETSAEHLGWMGEEVYSISQTPQVWLDHQILEEGGELVLNWDVVETLFPAGLIEAMFTAYRDLLQRLLTVSETWHLSTHALTYALLPVAQLAQRAADNADIAPTSNAFLHTLFLEQVAQRPQQLAVISPRQTLSYMEVAERAMSLGRQLRRLGAHTNALIAVVMEKGWEQVVATLGILLAGAAYLPIDAGVPTERLTYLLEHGEVQLVLTQSWLMSRWQWPEAITCVSVDTLSRQEVESSEDLPPLVQSLEDLAYVIYTSGSTGLPKGVMIDHRGAVNTIEDINRRFQVGAEDRVLALSSLSFDLSVYDVFGTLAAGGTIVMPAAAEKNDPAHWAELLIREQVTVWNSVPALLELLVDYLEQHPALHLPTLRLALLSGDWIPLMLFDRIKAVTTKMEVISLGGATEASIWSICYPIVESDPSWRSVPYGKPLCNQQWHILTSRLDPCPAWVPGDLYIGGIGLARGYWHDADRTAASFILHPQTGERLYRTGDRGLYLPDGTIEFLGREDLQVKIQGYRIELGEIEAALEQHPALRTATVVVQGEKQGEKRLIAYLVLLNQHVEQADWRGFLLSKLPAYMIPTSFVLLETLPLTANGKVDRQQLQTRRVSDTVVASSSSVSPTASALLLPIEQLTKIVRDTLQLDQLAPTTESSRTGGKFTRHDPHRE